MSKLNSSYNLITAKIENEFVRAKSKNPSFSLRAFAKKIGLPASALSEVLKGKRPITKRMANKIADSLDLSIVERNQWQNLFLKNSNSALSKKVVLSENQFSKVADWQHFAILSLMETKSFHSDVDWIAKRLGIDPELVSQALANMQSLKMIERDSNGKWHTLDFTFETSDGVDSSSIKRFQLQTLSLASKSLLQDSIHDRNLYSMTLAINPDKIPEAKRRMRDFIFSLSEFLESDTKTEVYNLSLQLFPLSRKEYK
jgi:uncharacterized protein (TIGR02147 family)